jgi:hypothetical protein
MLAICAAITLYEMTVFHAVRSTLQFLLSFGPRYSSEPITAYWQLYVPLALTFKKLRILSTQCIYVFRMVLTINSDYFPKEH